MKRTKGESEQRAPFLSRLRGVISLLQKVKSQALAPKILNSSFAPQSQIASPAP